MNCTATSSVSVLQWVETLTRVREMRQVTFIISAAAVGHRLRGRIRGRAFDGSEEGRLEL